MSTDTDVTIYCATDYQMDLLDLMELHSHEVFVLRRDKFPFASGNVSRCLIHLVVEVNRNLFWAHEDWTRDCSDTNLPLRKCGIWLEIVLAKDDFYPNMCTRSNPKTLIAFHQPHFLPNGFYWGHQCSWALPPKYKSPTCSLTTATGSNQAWGKVQTYFTREVWEQSVANLINILRS